MTSRTKLPSRTTTPPHASLAAASAVALVTLGMASSARAETYEIHEGDDLWARLSSLVAGDEVIVHAGTYAQSSRWEATWSGTAAQPIVVRAAEGEARPVLTRDANQNLMNLHGSYFTLRGFEITGGSHGIRLSATDHGTLEDLLIHGTDDVAISCNIAGMNCSNMLFRDNEIYGTNGTGEGFYLGCNEGACALSDSIVEHNYVHDLGGSQGDGIEIKSGSYGNTVRDNVVIRANYPGITMYTYEDAAGRTPNVIERNLIWSTNDNGIQVTGHAIIRNNIVIGAAASGIASQANQGTPTDVQILHNTVVGAGDACIRGSSWDSGTGFVIANNAVYCEGHYALRIPSVAGVVIAGNVGLGSVEGVASGFTTGATLAADLGAEATSGRVYPPAGSAVIGVADTTYAASDDFDLRARDAMPDVGAYERESSGMPVWLAAEEFKVIGSGTTTGDAGVGGTDAAIPEGVDGGPLPDGSVVRSDAGPGGSLDGTCGCSATAPRASTSALAALGVLAAALVARRRR